MGIDIHDRIYKVRDIKKKSQDEFGSILGVTKSTISLIETKKREPSERLIRDICREFSINENWLKTGEGEMFEQLIDQQKVMKYTAMLLKDTDSVVADAIKNFIVTYEQLDDASKKVLDDISIKYIENMKKGK